MKSTKYKGGYIHEVPLSEIEYIGYFHGKNSTEFVKNAYARLKKERGRAPDFLMNAELFDFVSRRAASDVVSQGEKVRLTEGYGIAFPENKTAVFSYKNNVNAPDYVGGYPTLVRNGKEEAQNPAGITGRRGRTALGLGNGNLYIVLIPDSNGATLSELRKTFIKAGAENAINLDGGGSTQFYAPTGNHFVSRAVRGFIGIWLKKNASQDVRIVKVVGSLRVRSGPGYGYSRIDLLKNGTKVTVLETSGAWCRIGEGRWVHSFYLKK